MTAAPMSIQKTITDPSIFNTATPQSQEIGHVGNGFLIAAGAITLLVIVLTVYIPWKYKAGSLSAEPKQVSGNRKLEIAMVGVPVAMVIFFFVWSVRIMNKIMPGPGSHRPDIVITAHQWWWEISYPGKQLITANELHIPVGQPVLLQLNAADVIHSWWVPAFGAKMDMIPGRTNYLWIKVTKAGVYQGACSEFCGRQHAWMRIRVIADPPQAYLAWQQHISRPAKPPVHSLATAGRALFMKSTCSNCHRIGGTSAVGQGGPDLTHFASRSTMLSGLWSNSYAHVAAWLTDPQKVKPGAHMPRFIFNQDTIRALTAYLTELK